MEIIQHENRNNIISDCCSCKVYLNTDECSGCLEHCSFIIETPEAFHSWLFLEAQRMKETLNDDSTIETCLIRIMRIEIIENQNQKVYELMDMVDNGETDFNMETLKRVAKMILDTKHTTKLLDNGKLITKQKHKLIKKKK